MLLLILVLSVVAGIITFWNRPHSWLPDSFRTGLDIQGGARVVLRAKTEEFKGHWDENANLEAVRKVLENRVNATGVSEPQIITKKPDQIIIELPGLKDEAEVRRQLQSTASLQFYLLPQLGNREGNKPSQWIEEPKYKNDNGVVEPTLLDIHTGKPVPLEMLQDEVFSKDPIASGDDLASSMAQPNQGMGSSGEAVILFKLKGEARDRFREVTRNNIGMHLAIFLDKRLLTAPVIESIIPGEGNITGNFTMKQASELSDQLNAGALPVALEEVEVRKLEATLGQEAVHATFLAGCLGLGLVLVAMLWWYRLPGLLANFALILYTLFSLALVKTIPITLTLPGVAGFILSIGMAVDANILIFERFKEEIKSGKDLRAAIDAGFKRAFTAIFDSNVCTMVTCFILYELGTGPIRGFALTLGLGVLVSMFTAIVVTRTFLFAMVGTSFGKNLSLFGVSNLDAPVRAWHVMRNKWIWLGLSLAIIVPGMIAWGASGIRLSIDFKGGTEQQIPFATRHNAGEIASVVSGLGGKYKDNHVVVSEDPTQKYKHLATVTTEKLAEAERVDLLNTLISKVGPLDTIDGKPLALSNVAYSNVSGTIGNELTGNAIKAVLLSSVFIVLYLALRFSIGGFKEGLKYGTCAVIALLHDVLVLWGSFALLGLLFGWQVDSLFVTAMLTVIGFSVHDTIIVFDRVRENLQHRDMSNTSDTFSNLTDRSIDQTIGRSIRTSVTVLMTLLALFVLGGNIIHQFAGALLIGIISGTYSSIFNASVLLVMAKGNDPLPAPPVPPAAPVPARPSTRMGETPAATRAAARAAASAAGTSARNVEPVKPTTAVPPTSSGAVAVAAGTGKAAEAENKAENEAETDTEGTNKTATGDRPVRPTTAPPRRQPVRKRRL